MSLRLKLFLVFGGLIAVLVFSQWLLFRSLNRDIFKGFSEMAVSVGRGMASIFVFETLDDAHSDQHKDKTTNDQAREEVEFFVTREESHQDVFVFHSEDDQPSPEHGQIVINTGDDLHDHDDVMVLRNPGTTRVVSKRIRRFVDQEGHIKIIEDLMCEECPDGIKTRVIEGKGDVHWVHDENAPGAQTWRMVVPDSALKDKSRNHVAAAVSSQPIEEVAARVELEYANQSTGDGEMDVYRTFDFASNVAIKLEEDNLILENDDQIQAIPLPRTKVDQAMQRASNGMMAGSLLILLVGLAGGGYIAHRVSKPLGDLSKAARKVGDGNLGQTVVSPSGYPEISEAINAFNAMSLRLCELDEINRRNQQREHLSELGEIARGFAHTIRNPLNTLGLSLEHMAALAGDSEQSRQLMSGAQKQIHRIDQLIRSFLALASEGRGQCESLDISGLVQDIALEMVQNNPGGIGIDVDLEPELPDIMGVGPELRSVVQALAVNALEASPQGSRVCISARTTEDGDVQIQITDQGAGLPAEVRNRLFTPHVTTKTYGSGMGLFLAHRLATGRYRGRLELEDGTSCGAVATLTLPEENDYGTHQNSGC